MNCGILLTQTIVARAHLFTVFLSYCTRYGAQLLNDHVRVRVHALCPFLVHDRYL